MDIRDAIGVSFSWSQFVKEMEKRGYTWKLNRKYPALKTPDMERYVRLRSLGKGYGEAEIREKILRPKIQQVYGKTQVQFPKRKLTGLQKSLLRREILPRRRRQGICPDLPRTAAVLFPGRKLAGKGRNHLSGRN